MAEKKLAIQYSQTGDPIEVVELVRIETPDLARDEVVVDVEAAPINPSHLLTLSGKYLGVKATLPAMAGGEGVGRVVDMGADVTSLKVGDRVLIPPFSGAWRQQLVAKVERLGAPLPDSISDKIEQVAMLPVNPPTAWLLLNTVVDLQPGDWVIQNAANSAVGQYVMQLARVYGFKTINVVRRTGLEDVIEEAGGTVCIEDGPDLAARVRSVVGADAPIRLGIDAVAGEAVQRLTECLSPGGVIANYGFLSGENCQIASSDIIFRDITLKGVCFSCWFPDQSKQAERKKAFEELLGYVQGGQLSAKVDATYPLSDIKKAVAQAARGGRKGKIILRPNL